MVVNQIKQNISKLSILSN